MGVVVKTIGSGVGRDFSTLAGWEASIPANLVTDGNSYRGEMYNDSEMTAAPGAGAILDFAAHVTDSTHTVKLTVANNQSYWDNVNVRTNPLKYDATVGVGVRKTDGYGTVIKATGIVNSLTIEKLQLARSNTGSGVAIFLDNSGCSNATYQFLICESQGTVGTAWTISGSSTIMSNVIWIARSSSSLTGTACVSGNPLVVGCAMVRPSDKTAGGTAYIQSAGFPLLVDCCAFGFTTASSGTWGTSSNNATDQASITGTSNQTSMTYSSVTPFTSAVDATLDFRSILGTSLVANGLANANSSTDISNTNRATPPAIGVWEPTVSVLVTPPYTFGFQVGKTRPRPFAPGLAR